MFVEILFWKTGREAMEIQEGYTPYAQIKAAEGSQKKKKSRGTLSPEEENEIMVLAEEFAALPRGILHKDEVYRKFYTMQIDI